MTLTTPTEFQRLLAAEFDRNGWEYDLTVGRRLVEEISRSGGVDGEALARAVPTEFYERNRTNRVALATALERAVGGRILQEEQISASLIIADNRYQVNLGSGAQISNSELNLGDGTQINVAVDAQKEDILAAVEVVLRAGLSGSWNDAAALALTSVIESRDDIDFEDVRQITTQVVIAQQPKQARVREVLTSIASGGLAGALATGLSAGLGELISQLPL